MYYLGVDIGGMSIKVGVVDEEYKILLKHSNKTRTKCTEEEFCDDVMKTINETLEKVGITLKDVVQVGIGCPGSVNNGVIECASNLNFRDFRLKEKLQERLVGMQISLENDANAAAYGEFKAGALKGVENGIAMTLGTGVGGGIIINSEIYKGFNFAAGEIGHMVISVGGRPCTCGRKGCFEAYSSATGLKNITKDYMLQDKDSLMWELVGGDIEKISGRTSFDAMKKNDATAKKATDEFIYYLAMGVTNMINILEPEIICIGGGVSAEGETLLAPLREICLKESFVTSRRTKIVKAELGNDAGIIGAALLGL